jgi:hypothetical protein
MGPAWYYENVCRFTEGARLLFLQAYMQSAYDKSSFILPFQGI